jgi:predicted dehydrogenase
VRAISDIRAGVVGTGFVGTVHVQALRLLGVEVAGVVGSSAERAAAKAAAPVYPSLEALLEDETVDVVHLTTPNHLHAAQARAALAAGKHVVCEKPLATTSVDSAELLSLAAASGLVHCTNFNLRFFPLVHDARARVAAGALGEVWNVHGGYLQDWLLRPTDWNWRLDPARGGALRAIADIGSHWMDMAQFVCGQRIVEVCADLATTIPVRRRPRGDVESFASVDDVEREDAAMSTDDLGHVLVRFEDGARGAFSVSQVSAGRKNMLHFEVDGSEASLAWNADRHEELWLGRRDEPNGVLQRNAGLMRADAAVHTHLPPGHPEGWVDTFRELYRAVYEAVALGGMPDRPDFPTFADGHDANVLCDAIARSNDDRRWVEVPR